MLSRIVAAAIAVVVATVCVRLGFWQLDRHAQRVSRNAFIEERLAGVPVDAARGVDADSFEFRRVQTRGVFDFSREVIEQGRMVNGVPAVYVVTPLVTETGRTILVERGYAFSPDARGVDIGALRERDSTVVEGVFIRLDGGTLPSDLSWPLYVRRADPAVLQPLFPEALEPLVLRRTVMPPDAPRGLAPAPLPSRSRGPHLSYAVQWFFFATIAVVGPLVASGVFRRGGGEPGDLRSDESSSSPGGATSSESTG
ncbi:MAG: SURF1 family protein [Gemmatimonadetes bacterium]|nr:SURF1 family protein [Gemmatimonadota bacterium]